ncbi:MAG: glucose-1-phosphate cytidylyltransferase [Bacteroidota bacterium]|nr:glucose-1-phosphate cytidylyltransferase [Bacteroidota bacterium]
MKVVILAGGLGTRLSEETGMRPKPMVEIGGKPILWHIMKIYSHFGFNDFVICAGYKNYFIKEYFANYVLHNTSITVDLKNNAIEYHKSEIDPWKVTIVDTGNDTLTGGRIKRVEPYLDNRPFLLTYGDGVGNIDIPALIESHKNSGKHCTLTTVQPVGRFGVIDIEPSGAVSQFHEKPTEGGTWINGGFFVCQPEIFKLLNHDYDIWEKAPLETLANTGQLNAFKHQGFWRPMDTLKDKNDLNDLWENKQAEWKLWE